jgi:hypothetical protein
MAARVTVTVISDGEAALPDLVRIGTGESIGYILDSWHISMRVRHVEQALHGEYPLAPEHRGGQDIVDLRVERLRHPIRNAYYDEARREFSACAAPLTNSCISMVKT